MLILEVVLAKAPAFYQDIFRLAKLLYSPSFYGCMEEPVTTPQIGEHDILFVCPSCRKNMVIDESAVGMTIDCAGCGKQVIVPPKMPTPSAEAVPSPVLDMATIESRIAALGSKLKELQTQRTEISNTIGARLNDISRQMVLLARLESSQQQVMQEWQQIVAQMKAARSSKP